MRWLTLWICLLALPVLGQRGVIHYTKEDGLISNHVNDLAYDDSGFLWLATNSGIDRFDGQRFIHFQYDPDDPSSICSNRVLRIHYDPKGFIWAGTLNGGLIRISTKSLTVRNYYFHEKDPHGISDSRATAIFTDSEGKTWFSPHYRGLDYYNAEKDAFVNYRPSRQLKGMDPRRCDLFWDILEDRNNTDILWCASLEGLFSFNKKTKRWKHFPVQKDRFLEKIELTDYEGNMRCLEQDGKGNLYIGTRGGGLLYFDQNQEVYKRFLFEDLNPISGKRNNISDIRWRDARYIYVCAAYYEFLLFDTKTKAFIRYDEIERTIDKPLQIARYGKQIAIAGSETGLFIHNESLIFGQRIRFPFGIQHLAFHPIKDEWLASNSNSKGELYYKGADGSGKSYSLFQMEQGHEFSVTGIHYVNKQNYLIVGSDCIAGFNSEKGVKMEVSFRSLKDFRPDLMMSLSSINVGDSIVWIGTKYAGLLKYSIKRKKLERFKDLYLNEQNYHSRIECFAIYRNRYLFFGYEEGVAAIDLRTGKQIDIGLAGILPRDQVKSLIISPDGDMWLGTLAQGIYVINLETKRLKKHITSHMGLQSQQVNQLVFDRNDRVWALNPTCVTVVNRSSYEIQSLENQHGMGGVHGIVLHLKTLYFLQTNGLITSTSGSALPEMNEPTPYIQRVRELNSNPFAYNKHRFEYNNNNLAFEFGVLDYSSGANNFVSYRMKGLEDAWRSGNGKDEASYYNLPGGDYIFQVRIIENSRTRIAKYPFKVIAPFWFRWWFIVLSLIIVGSSIWWYLRIRISRIELTEKMRTEFNRQINEMESKALRAQMNPHFLFNSLNSIRLFILKNEVQNASDYIAKFSKLLRMILNHSRQDMITVYDEIQSLKLYLEFERLRFDKGFEFDLQIDGQEVLDSQLPPMIVQPFVENAIWHGLMPRQDDKGHIKVSFERTPNRLFVTVEDNGIGRKRAEERNTKASLKEGSVALQITKDRLRSLTRRTKRMNDYEVIDLEDENGLPTGTLIKLYFETEDKP